MAVFQYKAVDQRGRQKKGIIEADTQKQVRQQLREQSLIPTSVSLTSNETYNKSTATSDGFASGLRMHRRHRVSASDLALITRQLATLVHSALPIEEALQTVAQQCDKARLSSMVMSVRARVLEGYSLADSLGMYPQVFDELFCATVAAGEKSGHLDTVLNRLADYTEERQSTRGKVLQALLYPIVLTVIASGVIGILLAVVVPQVVNQFTHMNQTLPLMTRILIAASDFVRSYGLLIIVALLLLSVLGQRLLAIPRYRYRFHIWQLHMPIVGKVVRGMNTSRFARTLSILTSSAVPLLEGMRISGEVLINKRIKEAVVGATERVREGSSLRAALSETKLFPPIMLHMIASGEKSGELEQMLARAADNQDREFDTVMTVALGLLGPLILVVMAAVVLFIVVAILQPILQLNNLVGI